MALFFVLVVEEPEIKIASLQTAVSPPEDIGGPDLQHTRVVEPHCSTPYKILKR
jgi:hypothetical protein